MTTQLEARAFAIWRYTNARDWDCSYDEIADATGLTRNAVQNTITTKGWGGRIGQGRTTTSQLSMREKNKGHRFDENNLDLCQIMAASS